MSPKVTRTNKYPAKCQTCGGQVPAGAGSLTGSKTQGWITRHQDGECLDGMGVRKATGKLDPTPEQQAALDLFAKGESMVIEAGAGTGKTSTLVMLAAATTRQVQYVAFNKAIVEEGKTKFGANVACNTAHSLAFRAVGKQFSHRLNAPRMSPTILANHLALDNLTVRVGNAGTKTLMASFLAGHVMKALSNFASTADLEPGREHFTYIDGIDMPTASGRRTFANNDEVATYLTPALRRAWADVQRKDGSLPFKHEFYLKMWQLSNPVIPAPVILFDEAQDANPVMAAVVAAQTEAQVVYVGDSCQAIYEFTGAVNTLAKLDTDHRVFLSQSFRFGPAIAEMANTVLAKLAAELRLVGFDKITSTLGMTDAEDAILTRTNAKAVQTVMDLISQGRRPHLVGGGTEVVNFAKAARDLQQAGHTSHPDLACFGSWGEVQDYVDNDAQGDDLRLMVNLVDSVGIEPILAALDNMAPEATADVIVSTAHKAKGREWDTVRIADDFPTEPDKIGPAEQRLMYVAVTRAKLHLDATALSAYLEGPDDEDEGEAIALPPVSGTERSGEDALRAQGWRG